LAIVHWEREPETGKVVQPRILFTLYSKAEALEALGCRDEAGAAAPSSTRSVPTVEFDRRKILKSVSDYLDGCGNSTNTGLVASAVDSEKISAHSPVGLSWQAHRSASGSRS